MDEALVAAVHEYWAGKRAEFGRPLLPRLWFEAPWAQQIGAQCHDARSCQLCSCASFIMLACASRHPCLAQSDVARYPSSARALMLSFAMLVCPSCCSEHHSACMLQAKLPGLQRALMAHSHQTRPRTRMAKPACPSWAATRPGTWHVGALWRAAQHACSWKSSGAPSRSSEQLRMRRYCGTCCEQQMPHWQHVAHEQQLPVSEPPACTQGEAGRSQDSSRPRQAPGEAAQAAAGSPL